MQSLPLASCRADEESGEDGKEGQDRAYTYPLYHVGQVLTEERVQEEVQDRYDEQNQGHIVEKAEFIREGALAQFS